MNDLIFESMHSLAVKLAAGEISSVELTEAALAQVERYAETLNPFITRTTDLALEMARQRDEEREAGTIRSPLHGIPIVLKDLLETEAIQTTGGSKTNIGWLPERDATVVTLLHEAGAVFIGKTGMPEFAEQPTSINPTFGPVRNPWNLERDTAGSSSGTAAAIASGMAWCGPGSDTGGSIRMPAAACGLVGLKPTYGRVSLRGVLPLAASRDHIGPMARTVEDAALLMNVLALYDAEDPYSRDMPVDDYHANLDAGIDGLRIGAFHDDGGDPVTSDILAGFRAGIKTLEAAGATVDEVDLSLIGSLSLSGAAFAAEVSNDYGHLLDECADDLSSYFREVLERGREIPGSQVIAEQREMDAMLHQLERAVREYDLIISPTLALHPPLAGEMSMGLLRFTAIWDWNGWPAISIPIGLSPDNIPIGFQIIGKPWTEALILQAARVIEQEHALEFPPVGLR